jgi:hypothetical protein
MKQLKQLLNIDESYTRALKKQKIFNKVKDNIPLIKGYNYSCDLLFLPTDSKTKEKYLLVVTDLADDSFDIEPLKDKFSKNVLNALLKIFKRGILKKPYSSISTDSGSEFKGVFAQYLYDNNIYHKIALPNRHTQQSNVERLNRTLGRLINGYLNSLETNTNKKCTNWTNILPILRTKLNEFRIKKLPKDLYTYQYPLFQGDEKILKKKNDVNIYEFQKPKFKIGDYVHYKLDTPLNTFGEKQHGNFREGDYRQSKESLPITKILFMNTAPYYRYMLKDKNNVSYCENQLKRSKIQEELRVPLKIVGKKKIRGETFYKIRWRGLKAKDDTWESENNLIQDGLENFIDSYNNNN